MFGFLKRALGLDAQERELKRLRELVKRINSLEERYIPMSDSDLASQTLVFKSRLERGETLDEILPEAFAVVREVSRRVLGMRHFDVQLMGGVVLHEGKIAEMKTGEGKTLVATLSAYLNALTGEGVHVVTVNDYLAKRDAEWMGPIYRFLGLSVGVIYSHMPFEERKRAYLCDITYGTNAEFGFDYLRDNMAVSRDELVQRGHSYAIVDEVDSILIDEARTPLIISGPSEDSVEPYILADRVARSLKRGVHFEVDEKERNVVLTEAGIRRCEELLKVDSLFDDITSDMAHKIVQALKAHHLFKRDVDYVVKDGEVIIVDEFTGRLMFGRRYSDGLHQSIEAKEGVRIGSENQTLATITLQNYFRMYRKLAGMTGTAATEAEEFREIYGLEVVVIPTHKPMIRQDLPDVVYRTKREKFEAVVEDIVETHRRGQPILVGTTSIETSELLSSMLKRRGIPHQVLNAKYHEKEAKIVAQAGRLGAVTIATNMAGRGTDIILGGNPHFLAREECERRGIELGSPEHERLLREFKEICDRERERVVELGGLYVLGTERHEARRIDNQLRGRSGRQGDPGKSRFYLSLEDDLLRLFGGERIKSIMEKLGVQEGEAIEHPLLSKAIESAQKKVESLHFEIRKRLLEYDLVMNKQREVVYSERRRILLDEEVFSHCKDLVEDFFEGLLSPQEDEGVEEMVERVSSTLKSTIGETIALASAEDLGEISTKLDSYKSRLFQKLDDPSLPRAELNQLLRVFLLHTVDVHWRDHLLSMDELRRGIGLRAIGQKDPLLEYQFESYRLFQDMLFRIKRDVVGFLWRSDLSRVVSVAFSLELRHTRGVELKPEAGGVREVAAPEGVVAVGGDAPLQLPHRQTPVRVERKVGRNEPCPCGSGKKYKHCCGKNRP